MMQDGQVLCKINIPRMKYNQGDIVLVPFPFTNASEDKVRPAIIISNSKVNSTKDIILAQITGQARADDFSYVLKDSHVTYSLRGYSEVRCNKIFTAEKEIVIRKISALKKDVYKEILEIISDLISE